jgi:dolichol-phosphate mannosyltransferase
MLRLAIVVPTYNEVNNVQTLVAALAETVQLSTDIDATLVIVDDSSPDGTAALVERLAPSFETKTFRVETIVKPTKEGLGAAYIYAFAKLDDRGFDHFLQMDADMSHDPKYLTGFIHQAKVGTDFVVASRYIPGGGTPDWSWDRKLLSRGGNVYARTMLSRRVTDWTGGFAMYSAALLKRITPGTITATGYGFQLVLKNRALRNCTSMAELPIVFLDRTHGSSKLPRNTLVQNLLLVAQIKLKRGL